MTKTIHEAGARILLGTDANNPLMIPGFSVHDELETMVEDGGMTPFAALLTSTANVGDFLNEPLTGRIAIGAPANLVLLEANPLVELETLRQPRGVMVNGKWLDRAALDRLLAGSRRR